MTAQRNTRTPVRGIQTLSRLIDPAGKAAETSTVITVNDNAILEEWANAGVPVHQLKGDGRIWLNVLAAAPVSPVEGDVWLEQDVVDGLVLRIRSSSGTVTLTNGGNGALELTASPALLQGHAVRPSAAGLVYAQAVVGQHRLVGLVAEDTTAGATAAVVVPNRALELPDWSLLTGAAALTPGASYWLSTTPGRFTTAAVAGCAQRVGQALTTTRLLVDNGLGVVG